MFKRHTQFVSRVDGTWGYKATLFISLCGRWQRTSVNINSVQWQLANSDANVCVESLTQLRKRKIVWGCLTKLAKSKAPPAKEAP